MDKQNLTDDQAPDVPVLEEIAPPLTDAVEQHDDDSPEEDQ